MRNCGLRKILHGTPLTEINNVVDEGLLLIESYGARGHTKAHRFDLSLYLLQTWLYSIQAMNRLSGVRALSFKYVVITDISRSAYSNLLSTEARCLAIRLILGGQCSMVDFT